METMRVIISGGGTGGHIFPAIAIADAIRRRMPAAEILFIGANGRMEMERVPRAGYPIEGLDVSALQRSFSLSNLSFPFKLLKSLRRAKQILKQFNPDFVVGVGGFASGPTLLAANSLGIPIFIQEQNSYPGITNRVLGKKAKAVFVAYDVMDTWFPADRIFMTGNPLRSQMSNAVSRTEALSHFNLDESRTTILVVGGSQGALGINRGLSAKLEMLRDSSLQMIWQTGKGYLDTATALVKEKGLETIVRPVAFIERMDMAYAAADVVVSRSGAMSISELAIVQKPVIFVPLPTAAEDHQTKNAQRLVDKEAALLVPNAETEALLMPALLKLASDPQRQAAMKTNISTFAAPDAADLIVEHITRLMNKR